MPWNTPPHTGTESEVCHPGQQRQVHHQRTVPGVWDLMLVSLLPSGSLWLSVSLRSAAATAVTSGLRDLPRDAEGMLARPCLLLPLPLMP